ncbi:hypothetical protein SLITO_v1c10120 [Spiroplasma litorale]|uniref:Transmembrane protein n=1 Tax=Spiroplasma litorale TaxID=216942 RepID=A0A0K1W365_9MOLU|nr:hypothetical protein SLITO_v1c10120 [Spiroplasma litorale]
MKKTDFNVIKKQLKKHFIIPLWIFFTIINFYIFNLCKFNCVLILINIDLILLLVILFKYIFKSENFKINKHKNYYKNLIFFNILIFIVLFTIIFLLFLTSINYFIIYNETNLILSNLKEKNHSPIKFINSVTIFLITIILICFILLLINSISLLNYFYKNMIKVIHHIINTLKNNIVKLLSWFKFIFISIKTKYIKFTKKILNEIFLIFELLISHKINSLYTFYRWSMIP